MVLAVNDSSVLLVISRLQWSGELFLVAILGEVVFNTFLVGPTVTFIFETKFVMGS